MSVVFRDIQIAVISPGSQTTLVQHGLTESLLPPGYSLPTRLFVKEDGTYTMEPTSNELYPLLRGKIHHQDAFHYFLKCVYETIRGDVLAPALIVVISPRWTKRQLEKLTKYLFEEVGIPALMYLPESVCVAFAYATPDCVVIDIGLDMTVVSVISDFETCTNTREAIPFGGNNITAELHRLIPELSVEQCEDLKKSGIVEVLGDTDQEEALGMNVEAEEGVVDVAAIVSSGRTREILEQREKERKGEVESERANRDCETNTFTDRHGTKHTVGRERFRACDHLVNSISHLVGLLTQRLPMRLQHGAWANIAVCGHSASIPGFRSGIITALERKFLVSNSGSIGGNFSNSGNASAYGGGTPVDYTQGSTARQTPDDGDVPNQAPTVIKLAHIADHFPEWRQEGWKYASFLGAQIAAKQSFSGHAPMFVSRQDYNEIGPSACWEMMIG